MKKIIVLLTVLILMTGCNKQIIDTTYKYDKAYFQLGGETVMIYLHSWKDFDGEQIQLTDVNGNVYLVSSYNTVLVKCAEK